MKSNGKFTYTSYDYSFLRPKPSFWESKVLPIAEKVYAKTIGADLTTVQPMNEPVGQLFYFEPTTTTGIENNGDITATVYEPTTETDYGDIIRGWEITLTPPATTSVTTDYSNVDVTIDDLTNRITDASNQIQAEANRGNANYMVTNSSTAETFDVSNRRQGTYTSIRYFPKHFGKTAADFMVANREAKKKQKSAEHFRRLNLIRKINKIRHGKKV